MKIPFYGIKLSDSNQIILSEAESRHCIKVLRYKTGDWVQVLDGRGNLYDCKVCDDNFQECTLEIINTDFKAQLESEIHIVVSPPKNSDRIDWLIEKSVELGARRISFAISERSIRTKVKLERLERISIAAMKQSYSRYKLRIDDMTSLNEILTRVEASQRLIPHLEQFERALIYDELKSNQNTCFLIGPEGDFTSNEIKMAIDNNFKSISLGDTRLRTETAAIMVIGAFNYVNGY
jgi:16S rRNA (uracil1498-N3)-methyltransferase